MTGTESFALNFDTDLSKLNFNLDAGLSFLEIDFDKDFSFLDLNLDKDLSFLDEAADLSILDKGIKELGFLDLSVSEEEQHPEQGEALRQNKFSNSINIERLN